jgi:hypothetical protein
MSNFYSELVGQNTRVAKTLTYNGKELTVYFRRLTAGERVAITRGQKFSVGEGKAHGVEMDAGETLERTHKFLSFVNVTETGAQVFKNAREVGELPEDLIAKLNDLANEALGEFEQDLGK